MSELQVPATIALHARSWLQRFVASTYGAMAALWLLSAGATAAYAVDVVSQSPLQIGGDVPGNVALALSVEFPTAISMGHQGNFQAGREYVGYFDKGKCYRYYKGSAADDAANTGNDVSHFYPVGAATVDFKCTASSDTWSGSFLNWMTMQAVDPFRQALTGGYRRVDTPTTTILERAWSSTNNDSNLMGGDTNFPPIPTSSGNARLNRQSPGSTDITDHTPLAFTALKVSVRTRGNQILFSNGGSGAPALNNSTPSNAAAPSDAIATHYTQGTALGTGTVYRVYARVKVCASAAPAFVESNCKQYSQGYKPEGLLQDYARRLRFSAIGYLNDPTDDPRDAGVLRARQKFIGPEVIVPGSPATTNANSEWDPVTGVMAVNPDAGDSSATAAAYTGVTVGNSGVINYVNKFGQFQRTYKRRDPVSELYYTALRYLKNQGNVSAWMPSTSDGNRNRLLDGFPAINTWDDPIQYACQKNYILGIGDTNSSWDKNLPGSTSDSAQSAPGGPPKPAAVSSDTSVNAATMRDKVRTLNGAFDGSASSNNNSDLMAGLAYHAATQDIRPDITNLGDQPRGQSVRTYWLDVLEFGAYTPNNLYYLATKYGGLNIPANSTFNAVTATAADIPDAWWHNSTDTVGGQPRPDNYYTVDDPQAMVTGLRKAFVSIVRDRVASASSLASNSTILEVGTVTYQAQFRSGAWSGELNAFAVAADGSLAATPTWNASADMLNGISGSPAPWAGRNIKTTNGTALVNFTWADLSAAQKTALGSASVVDYLRGDRSLEDADGDGLRVRDGILGDIVNSSPLVVGAPNPTVHAGKSYAGGSTYATFAAGAATRTPIVYVGANDGMLHAFDAVDGSEVFAYVPDAVIRNGLATYSTTAYEHRYFVDGETAAAEIYDTASNTWKTVVVGSLGRGGPGLFALDVTVPESPVLLWEKKGSDISVLGRNIGRPVIAQVASGDWRVFLGNGMDSGDGAQLIGIRLGSSANGTVTTYAADTTTTNGMAAALLRDTDADGYADTAYAGDLEGALWKISDIDGTATGLKMFQTADPDGAAQPITAAPMVGRDPATGYTWIFFGTGIYLSQDDLSDNQVQTWYGIIDNGSAASRSDLVDRDILVETTVAGLPARVIEEGTAGEISRGWFIDLVSPGSGGQKGERMVLQNRFQGSALVGTTSIADFTDPCDPGGSGWVMAINPFTGARLTENFFDMNGDGVSDSGDKYCNAGVCVPVSGLGYNALTSNPLFIGNELQMGLGDGTTQTIGIFGSSAASSRMSWRELLNN